jgi:hypothetical protein
VTGITDVITVGAGQNIMNIDCGLIPTGTIGDRVWNDANGNGLQDSGEVGVAGVTVTLTDGAGNPVTNAVGQLVGPTVTDANGNYQFDCLPSGTYKVTFSNLPANFSFTTPNVGGDDTIDSDANPTTGMTGTYTLTIGSSPVFENSVDAGIVFVRIEEPPPTGNEGGTPGFWKNNASKHGAVAWGPTGLLPSQKVNTVFSSVTGAAGNQTLLQALSAGGGGLTALLRQAVAAILNALHPDVRYPLTAAQVKTLVNNAVTAGGSAIESAKNTLEGYNELFHPLDQQGRRTIP